MYVGWIKSFVCAAAAVALIGCGKMKGNLPTASGIAVKVTSGFPGVVMVILPGGNGFCSGTIVSQYAVLTATHCLKSTGLYTVRGPEGNVTTSTFVTNGSGTVSDPNDIGFLLFNKAIVKDNKNIYGIANKVQEGDAVTLVGYGCDDPESALGGGIKRYGTNALYEKDDDFLILLTPVSTVHHLGIIGDSAQAGTCYGDSGGPMFVGNENNLKVAGVTHAGGLDSSGENYISEFSNVVDNSDNHSFVYDVNAQYDLKIQGI